jgi:sugar/nucleoside kinase (ribokinase family)
LHFYDLRDFYQNKLLFNLNIGSEPLQHLLFFSENSLYTFQHSGDSLQMKIPFKISQPKNYIAGVGSALVDICLQETEAFLSSSGAAKGGMTLVESSFIQSLLSKSIQKPAIVPGGSACNTILGIGKLGGSTKFIGKRGEDELGIIFENGLKNHNVEPILMKSSLPTGHVLSIITPDAQRSMLTYLGASSETQPSEITSNLFANTALVHLEGYLLFNQKLIFSVLKAIKDAGAMISLDLASYTVVEASKNILEQICHDFVDILIANEDEARVFTGSNDEQKALKILAEKAPIAVLKVGKRGSYIAHDGKTIQIAPKDDGSPVVDTTGAGDLWAAGFLYGLIHGYSLEKSGEIGSACGYEVCKVVGATIPNDGWKRIKAIL